MSSSSQVLRRYLHVVRQITQADTASLYVPGSNGDRDLLYQDGDRPVEELVDLPEARRFSYRWTGEAPDGSIETEGGWLVPVAFAPPSGTVGGSSGLGSELDARLWLGLRFCGTSADTGRPDDESLRSLFELAGDLSWQSRRVGRLLDDSVTQLPGRVVFQIHLEDLLKKACAHDRPLSLVLLRPADFTRINESYGREVGNAVIREISTSIRDRESDPGRVMKYGGAIFAVIHPDLEGEAAMDSSRSLLASLAGRSYHDSSVRLEFHAGVACRRVGEHEVQSPLDLMLRAEQALFRAEETRSGEALLWSADAKRSSSGLLNSRSGLFTADPGRDYRRMALLWETVDVLAHSTGFEEIASRVVERVFSTLSPDRVGLFHWPEGGEPRLLGALEKGAESSKGGGRATDLTLRPSQRLLIEEARRRRVPVARVVPSDTHEQRCHAVPLLVEDETIGCFYLDGSAASWGLDSADESFLRALSSQLALLLDRARLSALERARSEAEQRRMRSELAELRRALQQYRLEYVSEAMAEVVAILRRVAPTDATVLISGESGTGKELVSRTLHELSSRKEGPLVVVDCTAIPPTLFESELFGNERGAFTGADQRKIGRLEEADGGTVFLDEIGELPLEIQSKLLRFVQEKQLRPVGARRPRTVDVRVLAATHRDLASEVSEGRFRQDLYYRLNVVRVDVPSLRERPDDIRYLAQHFLERYTAVYRRPAGRFSAEAEEGMLRHPWPGNVRELENRIQQAVILSERDELGLAELGLIDASGSEAQPLEEREARPPSAAPKQASVPGAESATDREAVRTGRPGGSGSPLREESAREAERRAGPEVLLEELEEVLGREVAEALERGGSGLPALGRWLGNDLVLEASACEGGVVTRAALRIALPETTFRRRLEKAEHELDRGVDRSAGWNEVRELLRRWVESESLHRQSLLDQAQEVLLRQVTEQTPRVGRGAALMGVSAPTFRRRVADLECAATS